MQSVQLSVSDECKALGDLLAVIIADIKAGKGVAAIAGDALPGALQLAPGISALGQDIKLVDNQVYLLKALAGALEPQPA